MNEAVSTLFISFVGGLSAAIISHVFSAIGERIRRERKISDDLFTEVEQIIANCVAQSMNVWESFGGEKTIEEREVVCLVHDISTILSFLKSKGAKIELRTMPSFANFRRSVSGDNFDVKGRQPDLARVIQIRSDAIAFKLALRDVQYEANRLL
ncbi:MAG: hypothetical protein M9939_08325 [Mesorhizobium sp.]|nr:hypothetical protein [Mesorhizobium sp.]MCO5161128.1 hypothetical protein [Mesorhizobium sp.]